MVETLVWAVKFVAVVTVFTIVVAALLGSIFEANGETDEERERDYRDNCDWHRENDLRD